MSTHRESSSIGHIRQDDAIDRTRQGTTPPPFYVRTNRISCDACRKRKLRCNRVKPCSTCIKRKLSHQCYQQENGSLRIDDTITEDVLAKRPKVEDIVEERNSALHHNENIADQELKDRSHLTNDIAKCKDHMDNLVKMAAQSSIALKETLDHLSRGDGIYGIQGASNTFPQLKSDQLVVWQDVSALLPSVQDCEALITFYFEELCSYFRISQRPVFMKQWRLLLDGTGIQQTEAAIIFTAFALASIMIPSASTLHRHSREDHHRWMTLLERPASASLDQSVDNSFSKIKLLCMRAIYHLYEGRPDHLWEAVGLAMRKGVMFGLFDERTKSWLNLSNLDREYRRRLAWYLLVLDRWQAFVRQLPFSLDLAYVFLSEASFEADSQIQCSNLPARIVLDRPTLLPDGRLHNHISARRPGNVKFVYVELLSWCQDYLSQFTSMDATTRYNRALLIDEALGRVLLDGLYQTGIEQQDLQFLSTAALDKCIKDRHVEIISYICSCFFLRCMITRRFLTDENAPQHLRWISLIYAQGILSMIPSLTRIMNEGRVPVQTTWLSNFLLAAATTFTVVILGQDHYVESQSNPLEALPAEQDYPEGFPQEHVNWLADNIFSVLDCLETLSIGGNHSASIAKQLLERLCIAQGDLRKLYRRRFNKLANSRMAQNSEQQQQQYSCQPLYQSSVTLKHQALSSLAMSHSARVESAHSNLPSMSASTLLNAVLQDPTELDLLGHSHMDLLRDLLQDSPPILPLYADNLPVIASVRLKTGGSLSLLQVSTSHSVPSWARSIHPRRSVHDTSHHTHTQQSDTSDASSSFTRPPPRPSKSWPHPRLRQQHDPRRQTNTVQDIRKEPETEKLSEPIDVDSSSSPSSSSQSVIQALQYEIPSTKHIQENTELENRKTKRRPASKTVLNGGISHRERSDRRAQLKHIQETIGVREAQALQRRYEEGDSLRKEKRKAFIAKLRPYIEKQLKLIELESEEQRKEVEARKTWSLDKLKKEGWALDGLEGFWLQKEKEKKSGQSSSFSAIRTAVFNRPGKARLGWTKMQKGDQVELKKVHSDNVDDSNKESLSEDDSEDVCIGTVRSINENEVRINLEAPFHDIDLIAHPLWHIEIAYNDLIEQRLKDAVEALAHDTEATQRAGAELSGTRLVELLLEESEESKHKVQDLTIAKWIEVNRRNYKEPNYGSLNETQRQAIEMMLSEPISLIQGPPGTGKTSTIVAAIRILKQHYKIPHAILLTSHTNVAVDNLSQGCKDAGLNVIRAGAMVKVRDSLNDVTVEGLMEKHPSKPRLDELEASKLNVIKALQGLQGLEEVKGEQSLPNLLADEADEGNLEWLVDASLASGGSQLSRLQKKLSLLMQKTFVLRREMETDIFQDVDVVCCTALSAPLIRVIDFPLVFFDEASMATEPITIATMIKGCQQLSLIGDQQQLSPLVKSREVLDEGLGLSLFERLMKRGDLNSVLLTTQHRMHPSLSDFPNQEFYMGRLKDSTATSTIIPIQSSYIKPEKHLSFVNHKGKERVTKNKSLENKGEADLVIKIIANILCKTEGISGADIGIVTPYLGQKELLWKSLQDPTSSLRKLLANEIARLNGPRSRLMEVNDIEIHTIDGFEGREKKVILFSLVRANGHKYLGFLKEEKRWNVALTRAKSALVIVGNSSMLERSNGSKAQGGSLEEFEEDIFLHRYADHLRQHDCIIDAKDVQQSQVV